MRVSSPTSVPMGVGGAPTVSYAPPGPLAGLLRRADVRTDGARPWDLQVHRRRLYRRVLTSWSLGLGDAYVDGDWD